MEYLIKSFENFFFFIYLGFFLIENIIIKKDHSISDSRMEERKLRLSPIKINL